MKLLITGKHSFEETIEKCINNRFINLLFFAALLFMSIDLMFIALDDMAVVLEQHYAVGDWVCVFAFGVATSVSSLGMFIIIAYLFLKMFSIVIKKGKPEDDND